MWPRKGEQKCTNLCVLPVECAQYHAINAEFTPRASEADNLSPIYEYVLRLQAVERREVASLLAVDLCYRRHATA